jgi:hypothetical protein
MARPILSGHDVARALSYTGARREPAYRPPALNVDKTQLANIILRTEGHNRHLQERELWAQRIRERQSESGGAGEDGEGSVAGRSRSKERAPAERAEPRKPLASSRERTDRSPPRRHHREPSPARRREEERDGRARDAREGRDQRANDRGERDRGRGRDHGGARDYRDGARRGPRDRSRSRSRDAGRGRGRSPERKALTATELYADERAENARRRAEKKRMMMMLGAVRSASPAAGSDAAADEM